MLSRIEITNFRNLQFVKIEPVSGFNLFYGNNGSGKTSILEAIYYLSTGRSFRSYNLRHIINHHSEFFTIFGSVSDDQFDVPIGIEKHKNGNGKIRIDGQSVQTRLELIKAVPVQLINSDCYKLLELGPKFRRQFIDWGMFHVKHSYLGCWQRAQRALRQRNACLRKMKSGYSGKNEISQLDLWNNELEAASVSLHLLRDEYISSIVPVFSEIVEKLFEQIAISIKIEYYPGWNIKKKLRETLKEKLEYDMQMGYTTSGPHRADIKIKADDLPAQELLSRGQQKLLICALQLAQGKMIQEQSGKKCVYLIDDLPSELCSSNQAGVIKLVSSLNTQVFITGIERQSLSKLFNKSENKRMFHVKHGNIEEVV